MATCSWCSGTGAMLAHPVPAGVVDPAGTEVPCVCVALPERPSDRRTLGALIVWIDRHGYPPTIRQLAAVHGRASSTVETRLERLQRHGVLQRDPVRARAVRVVR